MHHGPLPPEIQDAIQAWHVSGWTPMRRLATPEDVGDAVLLLCLAEYSATIRKRCATIRMIGFGRCKTG